MAGHWSDTAGSAISLPVIRSTRDRIDGNEVDARWRHGFARYLAEEIDPSLSACGPRSLKDAPEKLPDAQRQIEGCDIAGEIEQAETE